MSVKKPGAALRMWNSLPWLQGFSGATLWLAAFFGAAAVVVSLLSSIAANRALDMTQAAAEFRQRQAEERIKANETETAKANDDAAQARLETEKLRAQFAWRTMTQAQLNKLTRELRRLRPDLMGRFVLVIYNIDPETANYGANFARAFERAGYTTMSSAGAGGELREYGVRVVGGPQASLSARLLTTLRAAGIQAEGATASMLPHSILDPSQIWLVISMKPPPT